MYPINYCVCCGSPMVDREIFGAVRRVCAECGFVHFRDPKVAVVVVIQNEGQLLLVKRKFNPEKGKWALPAGYVNALEDPRSAAVREAYEETGLSVEIEQLLDVLYNPPAPDGQPSGASIVILYSARVIGGILEAKDDAEEVGWFKSDTLPEIAFESTWQAVRLWLKTS